MEHILEEDFNDRELKLTWSRYLFQLYCKIIFKFYTPVEVINQDNLPAGPFIICSNHCSHLDTVLLMYAVGKPFHQIAAIAALDYWNKKSFFKRIIRKLLILIPVDRDVCNKSIPFESTIGICEQFLKNSQGHIIFYPEGTRSVSGELLPFKKGVVILANSLNIPVVPVFIQGSLKAWPKGKKFIRPQKISVTFGKAIKVSTWVNQSNSSVEVSKLSNEMMDEVIDDLRKRMVELSNNSLQVSMLNKPNNNNVEYMSSKKMHEWGFKDTSFVLHKDKSVELIGKRYNISGFKMPNFIPFLERTFQINLDLDHLHQPKLDNVEVQEAQINQEFLAAIKNHFSSNQYSFDRQVCLMHSHGQTTSTEVYRVLYRKLDRIAEMVFYCNSEDDAENIIKFAVKYDVVLVPYGGGTSVSSALELPADEKRMIVVVNMCAMNAIEWVDMENQRACIQAGITGSEIHSKLLEYGYTLGHEPDSVEFSTLGGWIATHASGMKKNAYGNIEDIVESATLITPEGRIENYQSFARISTGIEPQRFIFGSEGNLGLITKAVVKIYPKPDGQIHEAILFPSFTAGTYFLKKLYLSKELPASIRLMDNPQFQLSATLKPKASSLQTLIHTLQKFYLTRIRNISLQQAAIATVNFEGPWAQIKNQKKTISRLAKKHGGICIGAAHGQRGYQLTFAIAYLRDFLFRLNILGETFETTVPWSNIQSVCLIVKRTLEEQFKIRKLPSQPFLMYRITQLYHTGVCIYFTLAIYTRNLKTPEVVLHELESACRKAIIEQGGSISHHHGIGKLRKQYLPEFYSSCSIDAIKEIKKYLDPNNIFAIKNNIFGL